MSDRDDVLASLADEFLIAVKQAASEVGQRLADDIDGQAEYVSGRIEHLAGLVGQAGFAEAVRAERDSVVLRAAVAGVDSADALDARLVGVASGALQVAARAFAAILI